jgi:hypothetical protein
VNSSVPERVERRRRWPKLPRYVGEPNAGWIVIGLSALALLFAYLIVNWSVEHSKRFTHADRSATGRVVEYTSGDEETGDSSDYEFEVGGKVYGGSTQGELTVGDTIRVWYNSSDPNLNHAEGDRGYIAEIVVVGIMICGVVALLVAFIRAGFIRVIPNSRAMAVGDRSAGP